MNENAPTDLGISLYWYIVKPKCCRGFEDMKDEISSSLKLPIKRNFFFLSKEHKKLEDCRLYLI